MYKKKLIMLQFSSGIFLVLTGSFLMFFGIGPLPLRIVFGIIGITLIAKSPNILKIRKN